MAPLPNLPKDAVWFITGCSTGIGRALATHLLTTHLTTRVVATARNPSTLSTLPQSSNLLTLSLDVTSSTSISTALASTIEKFGRIDVLVNNAGYNVLSAAETLPQSSAQGIMDTNFWGAVNLTLAVLPIFRKLERGVVVQVSSLGGRFGFAGNSMYHASKFALEGWTEAVSKEMKSEWGIGFVVMEPGGVKSEYAKKSVAGDATAGSQKELEELEKLYDRDETSVINLLRKYHEDEAAMYAWAEAEDVAAVMVNVVKGGIGGELPFRVPIGADSWGLQMKGLRVGLERLEKAREVAVGVSKDAESQLKGIEFLEI